MSQREKMLASKTHDLSLILGTQVIGGKGRIDSCKLSSEHTCVCAHTHTYTHNHIHTNQKFKTK